MRLKDVDMGKDKWWDEIHSSGVSGSSSRCRTSTGGLNAENSASLREIPKDEVINGSGAQ